MLCAAYINGYFATFPHEQNADVDADEMNTLTMVSEKWTRATPVACVNNKLQPANIYQSTSAEQAGTMCARSQRRSKNKWIVAERRS